MLVGIVVGGSGVVVVVVLRNPGEFNLNKNKKTYSLLRHRNIKTRLGSGRLRLNRYNRAVMAGKAPKAWALPTLWVSIHSYKKQPVKKNWSRIWGLVWLKIAMVALSMVAMAGKAPRPGPCLDFGFQYSLLRKNQSKKLG